MRVALLLSVPLALSAQTAGLTPAWELKKQLNDLVAQTRRLTPVVDQVKVAEWQDAPAAYKQQQESVRAETGYLARAADALSANPEKMTLALETYMRLDSLESMLDSLSEGVRRYQNPALADLMQGMISENNVHRSKLRAYLAELVETKEAELRVMNEEAQRCRAGIMRTPASTPVKPKPQQQGK